jgi:hypothetical protein
MEKGTKSKTGLKDLKLKTDPLPRGSLREMLRQGAGSSVEPLRGPVATSETAVEFLAEGREEPVVQNLPGAKPKMTPLGVSNTDIPLQGASIFSILTVGGGLRHLISGVGGFRLANKSLSGCARRKMKRQKLRQEKQELAAVSNQEIQARLSKEEPPLAPHKAKDGGRYHYRNGQNSEALRDQ